MPRRDRMGNRVSVPNPKKNGQEVTSEGVKVLGTIWERDVEVSSGNWPAKRWKGSPQELWVGRDFGASGKGRPARNLMFVEKSIQP